MTRDFRWLVSFARLKDGISIERAQAAMDAIGARIAKDFPDSNKGWGVIVERYADTLVGAELRTALLVLMVATGLVLVIGCGNLADLALARGVAREREAVVQASLGAGRWLLIRQFLVEHILLSVAGGVLGILVGYVTMKGMLLLLPPFPFAGEIAVAMDGRVLMFALALGLGGTIALTRLMTALLFGIGPRDPFTMIAVAVVLGLVAMMASYVPSRRATRVDPIVALRYE